MWPILPKDCNCEETTSNQGVVCNNFAHTSDDFFYNGPNSSCTGIENHDDLTVVIQKLQNYLCSIEVTQFFLTYIEDNLEQFPEFITLVNDALTCQTITNCFNPTTTTTSSSTSTTTSTSTSTSTSTTTSTSSSTTTTTTTVALECRYYVLESDKPISSWTATSCDTDEPVSGIVIGVGTTTETGCIYNNSLVLSGLSIINNDPCPTTTTTSSTSTTSTTSTSSSTTTTTTTELPYACLSKDLLIINNSANTVEEVYADTWLIVSTTPTGPFETMDGAQNGTNNAISISLTVVEPGCVSLYVNSVLVQTIPFYYTDVFVFDPVSIGTNDCVWFIVSNEC